MALKCLVCAKGDERFGCNVGLGKIGKKTDIANSLGDFHGNLAVRHKRYGASFNHTFMDIKDTKRPLSAMKKCCGVEKVEPPLMAAQASSIVRSLDYGANSQVKIYLTSFGLSMGMFTRNGGGSGV